MTAAGDRSLIRTLYNFSIMAAAGWLRLTAFANPKTKAFVDGRKDLFRKLESTFRDQDSPVWIHCASLGEFEQGRPVIEQLKAEFPSLKILITFFSPSGYEVRKNYELADYVFYLPLDSPGNAAKFIDVVRPVMAIFIKYEFWHNYIRSLYDHGIPLLSVSAIFRRDQLFFKPYGGFFRQSLFCFRHFFVQNRESLDLLKSVGITQCTLAGDTRFDRVASIVTQGKEIPLAVTFKGNEKLLVAGSCWPDDMEVLIPFINEQAGKMKFIIAPHEISETFIASIESAIHAKSIRYSSAARDAGLENKDVLIIDNVGLLSALYRYGEFAFVGGAYGKGLHNILEAACYGLPVFFGNRNYDKYEEANELIRRGGAYAIADYNELRQKFKMISIPENFMQAVEVTRQYVDENLGATKKIMAYCRNLIVARQ